LNNELNALFNSSADGLVISDERGTLLKMNRAYEEIIGVKASEFIGIPAQELVNRGFLKEVVTPKAIELKKRLPLSKRYGARRYFLRVLLCSTKRASWCGLLQTYGI